MPPNGELNWQRIMEIGASAFGSTLAVEMIKLMFPTDTNSEQIMKQAVDEICARVKKIVDQAFLNEYMADCNSIASRLAAYPDSHDITILQAVFNEGSNLIYRLRRFDTFEGITTVNYMSTLHLAAVKALSEHSPEFSGYRETLKRLGKEYAEWCESHSERLNDFARESVTAIRLHPYLVGRPYHITKKSVDSNIPEVTFGYVFYDRWNEGNEQSAHLYVSPKFQLTNLNWYNWEIHRFGEVTLNENGKNAPEFLEASKNALNEATNLRDSFFNDRLSKTNSMKECILASCEEWKKF
ncbi:hypothetical protein [Bacillus cereus]|uniref:hypothetical protein n=1 Tax=Bacillus cereus TaxID=1396 RepID=UPI003D97B048